MRYKVDIREDLDRRIIEIAKEQVVDLASLVTRSLNLYCNLHDFFKRWPKASLVLVDEDRRIIKTIKFDTSHF